MTDRIYVCVEYHNEGFDINFISSDKEAAVRKAIEIYCDGDDSYDVEIWEFLLGEDTFFNFTKVVWSDLSCRQ